MVKDKTVNPTVAKKATKKTTAKKKATKVTVDEVVLPKKKVVKKKPLTKPEIQTLLTATTKKLSVAEETVAKNTETLKRKNKAVRTKNATIRDYKVQVEQLETEIDTVTFKLNELQTLFDEQGANYRIAIINLHNKEQELKDAKSTLTNSIKSKMKENGKLKEQTNQMSIALNGNIKQLQDMQAENVALHADLDKIKNAPQSLNPLQEDNTLEMLRKWYQFVDANELSKTPFILMLVTMIILFSTAALGIGSLAMLTAITAQAAIIALISGITLAGSLAYAILKVLK